MTTRKRKFGGFPQFIAVLFAVCGGLFATETAAQQYQVTSLDSLGGTNSRGNSINNRSWVAGYSNLSATVRHAALWRDGLVKDLGTLGSPERNSNVTWSVKNNNGLVVGISQTDTPMPLGENWSCSVFFPFATRNGYTCLGFIWENDVMRQLNPLPGGNNSFATGANNRGEVVGWAENGIQDTTCRANNQVLQFLPVVWQAKSGKIKTLPTLPGDSSGSATAINNKGQIVGITGDCDQAVGRHTARHAVLWDRGSIIDLGNLGAPYWNTPTAINQRGDIVGFAGVPGDEEGNIFKAFMWTKEGGIVHLPPLTNLGHVDSEAYGINERRQVVGYSCDVDFVDCRAVLWENGTVKDLNDYIAGSFPARLEQAKDINEAGEITGRTVNSANVRTAFLAVPIPGSGGNNKKESSKETRVKVVLPKNSGLNLLQPIGFDSVDLTR